MEIHDCVLIVFLLGSGVDFSTQNTRKIQPELSEMKCYIKEIESFNPNGCSGVEEGGHTVRHQGGCIVDGDQTLTCVHGHWSGTDSSVELLQRNKRLVWLVVAGTIIRCMVFCVDEIRKATQNRPSFPRPCTPKDIKDNYNVDVGENSAVVNWTEPSATDRDGGTPRVIQVEGGANGGRFLGTTYGKNHRIRYKATDSDGLSAYCYFSFSVTILTCNLLPWLANGARKCDKNNILGSTCHYTCNNGYKLTGPSTITCENAESPSWSAIPTCDKMACSEPKYPLHSTVTCSDSLYGYQSICVFNCDSGYALKGATHIQCQADGKWSNYETSSCIDDTLPIISCVTPQIFYADRGVTTTITNWQLPTASDIADDNPSIVQTYGPTMGSLLEVGTKIVKYKAVNVNGRESQECFIQLRIEAYDACMTSPCNGNNCTNIGDRYICTCHGGWSGTNCTTPPDYCADNACENGATCISGSTNYTCNCVLGYSGLLCEIPQLDTVDGGWSEWAVSECSKTCGAGSMKRTRQCNSPVPDKHGADCDGGATETIACNTDACPVCKDLRNTSGTVLNCTTDEATGSKACTIYCEDGKVLPPGLIDEESFTCGPSTNYEWGYLENAPSCVDPVSPGNINITMNIEYVIDIPDSVVSRFVNLINEQILTVPCFDSISCHTHIEIAKSDMTIVFSIPISRGTDIEYSGSILSGIRDGVLKEAIDALNSLEQTAQYIQNNTNKLFDVIVDDVTYTGKDGSLTLMAGVLCNGGFVPYGGFCVTCPMGTHSIDDVCTFCEKGQYQSDAGKTSCIPCPSGQTTNTIGSQCIVTTSAENRTTQPDPGKIPGGGVTTSAENRTTQPDPGKIPGGGDDTINVMMLASVVSVLALVVAIAAICVVCYKNISSKSSVAGPSINLRPSTAGRRFIRNGRRTPMEVPAMSEFHLSDTIREYDDIQSSDPYYARILSYDSMYLTPGNMCMRCSDPPPHYDLESAQYIDKECNEEDNAYAVIEDNISTA